MTTKPNPQNDSIITDERVKDERLRDKLFPDAASLTFNVSEKGFVPFPMVYRKLFKFLTPPQARVLMYLHLRASKHAICYPPPEEMAHDLGLSSRKKLTPHINALLDMKFISSRVSAGKAIYLIHHPRMPAIHLREKGLLTEDDAFGIDELMKELKQKPIEWPSKKVAE